MIFECFGGHLYRPSVFSAGTTSFLLLKSRNMVIGRSQFEMDPAKWQVYNNNTQVVNVVDMINYMENRFNTKYRMHNKHWSCDFFVDQTILCWSCQAFRGGAGCGGLTWQQELSAFRVRQFTIDHSSLMAAWILLSDTLVKVFISDGFVFKKARCAVHYWMTSRDPFRPRSWSFN